MAGNDSSTSKAKAQNDDLRLALDALGLYPTARGQEVVKGERPTMLRELTECMLDLNTSDLFCLLVVGQRLGGTAQKKNAE